MRTLSSPHPLLVPAIAAAQFAPPFMVSGVAVALPALGADTGAGAISLTLVETVFLAAAGAMVLPFGRLADAADKASLYKGGMALFALVSVLTGLVSSAPAIIALRFVQGACGAAVAAAGPALIADAVPPERRGGAYGLTLGAVYAGLTLGPVVAGFLVELAGWRAVFIGGGVLVFLLLLPIHFMLPANWRRPAPGAVHLPSSALVVGSMLLLVGGAAMLREGAAGWIALAAGIALLAAFLRLQRRLERPLLNVQILLANAPARDALIVQWLLYTNAFGTIFLVSIHVQAVLGRSADTAGQVIALGTILMALIAPASGRLADRFRPAVIASAGVAVALASALMATRLGMGDSLAFVAAMLAVHGVGFAFFSTPNMTIVMNAVPPDRTGIAAALSATSRQLGMMSGMVVVGAIISVKLGHDPVGADPAKFVETMRLSFWLLAGLNALALALSLIRSR